MEYLKTYKLRYNFTIIVEKREVVAKYTSRIPYIYCICPVTGICSEPLTSVPKENAMPVGWTLYKGFLFHSSVDVSKIDTEESLGYVVFRVGEDKFWKLMPHSPHLPPHSELRFPRTLSSFQKSEAPLLSVPPTRVVTGSFTYLMRYNVQPFLVDDPKGIDLDGRYVCPASQAVSPRVKLGDVPKGWITYNEFRFAPNVDYSMMSHTKPIGVALYRGIEEPAFEFIMNPGKKEADVDAPETLLSIPTLVHILDLGESYDNYYYYYQ